MLKRLIGLFAALLLASCGGGDPAACSTETTLFITSSWNSNGSIDSRVSGKVGVPLVATPTITGIPASCKGQQTFAVNTGIVLPEGLSLNATSGVISGTPAKAIGIAGPACCGGLVTMELPGYKAAQVLGIINIAP